MKINNYKVSFKRIKNAPTYTVFAPNKRIAKWVGANIMEEETNVYVTARDIKAVKFTFEENSAEE